MMKYYYFLILILFPFVLSAQCYPDRHNTSWTAAWISCETAKNPNENRGQSHWAYYDFGNVYALADMKLWNLNTPDERSSGMRTFEVDYSLDGQVWTHLGSFEMDQAPGTSIYEGETVTDWNGLQARYVIITPTDNFGGGDCVGFSEVRFNLSDQQSVTTNTKKDQNTCLEVNVYPNPYTDYFTLDLNTDCQETIDYTVTNVLGQTVLTETVQVQDGNQHITVQTGHLPAGNYALHVRQGDRYLARSLVQMKK